jgi:hypothetical protein
LAYPRSSIKGADPVSDQAGKGTNDASADDRVLELRSSIRALPLLLYIAINANIVIVETPKNSMV